MPNKRFYGKHKDRLRTEAKKYYEDNKEAIQKRHKEYFEFNRIIINERNRDAIRKNRKIVLEHYGHKCQCCGENKFEFMAIDHINGKGDEQRKIYRSGNFFTWIIKNNFPDDLRILCHNCNSAIGFYGYCPHQKK